MPTTFGAPGSALLDGLFSLPPSALIDGIDALTDAIAPLTDFVTAGFEPLTLFSTGPGNSGSDAIIGSLVSDVLRGGRGDDLIFGGFGDDIVLGGGGRDFIAGGLGNDVVFGGADSDVVIGGAGNDIVSGGAGDDFVYGGAGADTFVVGPDDGIEVLQDFDVSEDQILLLGFSPEDVVLVATDGLSNGDSGAVAQIGGTTLEIVLDPGVNFVDVVFV